MIRPVLLLALLAGPVASADVRSADGSAGRLEFQAVQAGATFTGRFRRFQVRLDLDPAAPAAGRLDVTVETASVDSQDAERDEILRGADFFWTEQYPRAEFHATRIERAGAGWRATGALTIRGVTREVPVDFTLGPAGAATALSGRARLARLPFGLGQGDWSSTEWVGDAVDVRFDLALTPAG